MWLVIVSMFLYGRYLSGMLWGCLIGNKFHTWRLCLGNIQTNSIWTGFVFDQIRHLNSFATMSFVFLFSTEIDLNYFILHCSVSVFSLQATFNYFPNNILNKNIFKTKALQPRANVQFSRCSDQVFLLVWTLIQESGCPRPLTHPALPLLIWGIDRQDTNL